MRYASLLVATLALGLTGWVSYRTSRAEAAALVPDLLAHLPPELDPEAPGIVLAMQPDDCLDALAAIGLLNRLRLGRRDAPTDALARGVVGLILSAPRDPQSREDIRLVTGAEFPLVFLDASADDGFIRHARRLGWDTTPFLLGYHQGRVRFIAPLVAVDSTHLESLLGVLVR